jgi:nucleoside-diphosphate-sugar epimerase
MNVLVCGCNGYIGNALVQRLLAKGYNVVGIDNDIKFKWTTYVDSCSCIPLATNRRKALEKLGHYKYFRIDIAVDVAHLNELFSLYTFDTVVNLAQQPSAAYSHLSLSTATETFTNNNIGTLNLLWLLNDFSAKTHYIEIESMGCTAPDIGVKIEEGLFQFKTHPRKPTYHDLSALSIFPKRPGSFYHGSKVNNTYLVDMANRFWNIPITAVNQGIVYGNYTEEIAYSKIHSPLWVDEYFGTVVNRFIAQSLINEPLYIYGKGEQRRGFLSLNDSVQSLELLIDNPPQHIGVRFVNQLSETYSIMQLADIILSIIPGKRIHIKSPRVENTDTFYYDPVTRILPQLGFKQTRTIQDEIKFITEHINLDQVQHMKQCFAPHTQWSQKHEHVVL